MQLNTNYLLTGNELSTDEIQYLLELAKYMKVHRHAYANALSHKHLALMFDKQSLRTRISFSVAMQELGGQVIESSAESRKNEEPEDQMRVIQGYCHALMIRTHGDEFITRMLDVAKIPVINGLSNLYHPCQILADLLTLQEHFNKLDNLSICYIGDGNNILHSLLLMAPKLGIEVHYCCPQDCEPNKTVLAMVAENPKIKSYTSVIAAAQECVAIYTDVWTSMGFTPKDDQIFNGYQVNEEVMAVADKNAIFMHCMPMNRGKEVSMTLPDQPCSVVFQQSENRLHAQKSLLFTYLNAA